jgi:hypothetical protein
MHYTVHIDRPNRKVPPSRRSRYCASLVIEPWMGAMLAFSPARLGVPIAERNAVVLRSELSAKKN